MTALTILQKYSNIKYDYYRSAGRAFVAVRQFGRLDWMIAHLYDTYSAVCNALDSLIARGLNIAQIDSVVCCLDGFEAASPIALRLSLNPRSSVERLICENRRQAQTLLGVSLISAICENGGHICFALGCDAYVEIMRRIITEMPLPPAIVPRDDAGYAYMRMRMYAEHFSSTQIVCPDDESVRCALWRCLGLCQAGVSEREERTRLNAAVLSVLSMAKALPYLKRQQVLRSNGVTFGCVARLLYFAISHIGG